MPSTLARGILALMDGHTTSKDDGWKRMTVMTLDDLKQMAEAQRGKPVAVQCGIWTITAEVHMNYARHDVWTFTINGVEHGPSDVERYLMAFPPASAPWASGLGRERR